MLEIVKDSFSFRLVDFITQLLVYANSIIFKLNVNLYTLFVLILPVVQKASQMNATFFDISRWTPEMRYVSAISRFLFW